MVVKNWRMSTQGDSGNFLKHWNCSGACAMPPSIAKQPVVFAPRHFVPTDDAMTHLYIHLLRVSRINELRGCTISLWAQKLGWRGALPAPP